MGRVLIDEDEAVRGLGHDVGCVQLGPRRAERMLFLRLAVGDRAQIRRGRRELVIEVSLGCLGQPGIGRSALGGPSVMAGRRNRRKASRLRQA